MNIFVKHINPKKIDSDLIQTLSVSSFFAGERMGWNFYGFSRIRQVPNDPWKTGLKLNFVKQIGLRKIDPNLQN